jgi:hypothetical protein
MYSNRGENPHSPRFQYAELKANGCTSLTDSLYPQITGKRKRSKVDSWAVSQKGIPRALFASDFQSRDLYPSTHRRHAIVVD